jgi:hypothetical protein
MSLVDVEREKAAVLVDVQGRAEKCTHGVFRRVGAGGGPMVITKQHGQDIKMCGML